jgi:hypothetical protein
MSIFARWQMAERTRQATGLSFCKPCATPKTAKEQRDRGKSKRIAEGRTQADKRAQKKG